MYSVKDLKLLTTNHSWIFVVETGFHWGTKMRLGTWTRWLDPTNIRGRLGTPYQDQHNILQMKEKSYKHDLSQIKKRRRSCEKKGQKVTFDFDTFFLDPEWHWWRLIRSDIGFDARWINICYFGYAATYLDETFVLGVKCDLSEKTKVQFFSEFDFGPEFLMHQHPCNFT